MQHCNNDNNNNNDKLDACARACALISGGIYFYVKIHGIREGNETTRCEI